MKKKLLSLIAVSAALAVTGSALVACGGNGDNGAVDTKVTGEQWVAAFAADNFTSNVKINVSMLNRAGGDNAEDYTEEYTFIAGDEEYGSFSLSRAKYSAGVKTEERTKIRIVGADEDTYYSLSGEINENDEWEYSEWHVSTDEHQEFDLEEWTESVLGIVGFEALETFVDKYDSFKASGNKYVLNVDSIVIEEYSFSDDTYSFSYAITADTVSIEFADGKLVSVLFDYVYHHESQMKDQDPVITDTEGAYSFKISYGKQTVSAPDIDAE